MSFKQKNPEVQAIAIALLANIKGRFHLLCGNCNLAAKVQRTGPNLPYYATVEEQMPARLKAAARLFDAGWRFQSTPLCLKCAKAVVPLSVQ